MTTIKSLHEDLLYTILSRCSSSIDMWHLLLALNYELTQMINLRAFWSHVRLTSLDNKNILFSFVKEIGVYCVDLRIDNLNWMVVADLRRLLSNFRSVVYFHSGNVALSKSTLINDIQILFPYLKSIHLLISHDQSVFQDLCLALNQIKQLESISLILEDKKEACLSDKDARMYFRSVCEYISNLKNEYKFLSIEENRYEIKNRFSSNDIPEETSFGSINLSLISTLKHLIISFRSMLNTNLTLEKNSLQLETLVLPCLPLVSNSIDLKQLQILDIGFINVKNQIELNRLDQILLCYRQHSLRNLTISLNQWQTTRLVVKWKRQENSTTQFSSVFENCFDEIITPEEKENPFLSDQLNIIDEYSLEFLDDNQSSIFQISLNDSWLNKLTNLNLTGIHCHSIDFKYIFNSLYFLRSLSLSPCLLFYIDQLECHCQTISTNIPYQIHSLNKNLLSINLVLNISNPKELCTIFYEQYKLHSIRHSSIHQHLNNEKDSFEYKYLIRYSIQTIFQTLDLHNFSIRIPNYNLHIDDLRIENSNHLETLILDVKIPVSFHTKLAQLYSINILNYLRRFILISESNFELTPLLIDRFRTLEIIEIISINYHLNRSTIIYLQTVLKPINYPNLKTFHLYIGSTDAKHLLKHLHKTIRLSFENIKPGFQFNISIMNPLLKLNKSILYDNTHEIHRNFHSLLSINSNQLSIIYPNFLNYKPLYSEQKFAQ